MWWLYVLIICVSQYRKVEQKSHFLSIRSILKEILRTLFFVNEFEADFKNWLKFIFGSFLCKKKTNKSTGAANFDLVQFNLKNNFCQVLNQVLETQINHLGWSVNKWKLLHSVRFLKTSTIVCQKY